MFDLELFILNFVEDRSCISIVMSLSVSLVELLVSFASILLELGKKLSFIALFIASIFFLSFFLFESEFSL